MQLPIMKLKQEVKHLGEVGKKISPPNHLTEVYT